MKRLISIVMVVMLCETAGAEEFFVAGPLDKMIEVAPGPDYDVTYYLKDGQTTVKRNPEYIEVVTRNSTYRIYPGGKLEKLTWKELAANEDKLKGLGDVITVWPSLNQLNLTDPIIRPMRGIESIRTIPWGVGGTEENMR